ncbi:MAG: valine--tRNA ligase [Myxococcota bacterium]|nr:valine--tRNA ligase [Myxococcota bacterium]
MTVSVEEVLPKVYDPNEAETRWYQVWSDAGLFRPGSDTGMVADDAESYVIMMPPPNVTGTLHMGHALTATIQDMLIRYHRMKGFNTLYLPGTDHAGIATQTVVERELTRSEGKTRHDLGRDDFLERVWAWKDRNGSRIIEQLKTIGVSADWDRLRFTMDEQCSHAVRTAFVQMWNDDLIYRGERLVNWDPKTRTALSDEEVEHEDRTGELWRFAYQLVDGSGEIVVATTRPETMLGDTAVAVHPDDERYTAMIGKHLRHPFFPERVIPVIADAYVDREFGTGAVKITPAHDPNDFEIGTRHTLPMINILTFDGRINEQGGSFQGLDRYDARREVKGRLEALGLTRGSETITHSVSISQRSGVAIEPMLSRQYFVKTERLAKQATDAIKSNETQIIPESWEKTWDHFMDNIRDWCISRQLWWGHRIPVFYDTQKLADAIRADANTKGRTEALEALEANIGHEELLAIALNTLDDQWVRSFSVASVDDLAAENGERYIQENDVLDTWFSSGLWPFSTLGWPENTDDLARFYPGAVLETGFDILFFWVARMMMMGTYFMGKAPFADVYLHAMVRDSQGRKMSKSLGNTVDPLDVIRGITLDELVAKTKTYPVPEKLLPAVISGLKKEFPDGILASGADGLRFTLVSMSGQGRAIKLSIPRVAGYRAYLNKIWNATRFALMNVGTDAVQPIDAVRNDLSWADRWILSRLQRVTARANTGLRTYHFHETADGMYHFFWDEFCDWYIELVKSAVAPGAPSAPREAARSVLMHVIDQSMRLLHPLCPFQTEEIWQKLPGRDQRWPQTAFCAVAPYPDEDAGWIDEAAEFRVGQLQETLTLLRNARHESGLPISQKIPAVVITDDDVLTNVLREYDTEFKRLAKVTRLETYRRGDFDIPEQAAVNSGSAMDVVVLLEGLIDFAAERERLTKEIAKIDKVRQNLVKRLSNEGFRAKAPAQVIEESEAKLAEFNAQIERLDARLSSLPST